MVIPISQGWFNRRLLCRHYFLVIILSLLILLLLTSCSSYPDYAYRPVTIETAELPAHNSYGRNDYDNPAQRSGRNYQAQSTKRDRQPVPNQALLADQNTPSNYTQDYLYYPTHPKANKDGFVRIIGPYEPNPSPKRFYNSPNRENPPLKTPSSGGQSQSRPGGKIANAYPEQFTAAPQPMVTNVNVTEIQEPAGSSTGGVTAGATSSSPYSSNIINSNRDYPARSKTASGGKKPFSGTTITATTDHQASGREDIPGPETITAPPRKTTAITTGGTIPALKSSTQATIKKWELTQPALAQHYPEPGNTITRIEKTITDLESYVTSHPKEIKAQLALRLLYSVYGNDDKALQHMSSLSGENQLETLVLARAVLFAAHTNQASLQNKAQAANRAVQALDQLIEKIAEDADLHISCLKICNEVTGFGQYEVVSATELQTGKPRPILVYCELENFKAALNQQGKYYTQLHANICLFDSAYRQMVRPLDADVEDTPSYNQRRDFFLRGPLNLPQLAPGQYEIVVSIEDKNAHKIATKRIKFEVKGARSGL